jgi:hypothetical protein
MKRIPLMISLALCGCDSYVSPTSWLNADERYQCSDDQMRKVERETMFCKTEVLKSNPSICYGGAIMRNCEPIKDKL